jgi:hypothetical protein
MSRHPAERTLLSLLVTAVLAGLAPAAWACFSGYRSLDFQVAESPLILIGSIIDVRPDPTLSSRESRRREGVEPAVANVRVIRVLKGRWAGSNILVGSGPIASCSPSEEYMTFQPGRTHIFILPTLPREGKAVLEYWGSLLDMVNLERVEARLNRARQFRADHLKSLRRSSPKYLEAAQILFGEIRDASKT